MVIGRASARWASRLFGQTPRAAKSTNRTRSWQQAQRRTYASGGDHGSHQKSSLAGDLPWAIGSTVVTVPACWYLAQPQIERIRNGGKGHGGHGHEGGGHDEHVEESEGGENGGEEGGEKGGEEGGEEDGSAQEQDSGQDAESEEGSKEGKDGDESENSGSEGGKQDTPDTSDDEGSENVAHEKEGGSNVEGVQFKGATSGGSKEGEQGDTRKHIPDAKGFNKKRIESDYAIKSGESQATEQDAGNDDLGAASKPAGSFNKQSGKQEGLSNTDTKHSTDIANDPEKSKKSTGGPDTAKEKGTVDSRAS